MENLRVVVAKYLKKSIEIPCTENYLSGLIGGSNINLSIVK